jgi:hypothetical protein
MWDDLTLDIFRISSPAPIGMNILICTLFFRPLQRITAGSCQLRTRLMTGTVGCVIRMESSSDVGSARGHTTISAFRILLSRRGVRRMGRSAFAPSVWL